MAVNYAWTQADPGTAAGRVPMQNSLKTLLQKAGLWDQFGATADTQERYRGNDVPANWDVLKGYQFGSYGQPGQMQYEALKDPTGATVAENQYRDSPVSPLEKAALLAGFTALTAGAAGFGPLAGGATTGAGAAGAAGLGEGGLLSLPSSIGTIAANGAPLAASGFAPLTAAEIGGGLSSLAGPGALAAVGGSAALGGAAGGAGGASNLGGALGSADKAAMFSGAGYGPGMTGGQTGLFDSVLGATGSPTAANAATSALGNLTGGGLPWGQIAGAALGALSSKDQTQATNRDPWAPAQDFIKQQIGQGQQLANQYQQQPFSAAQQTGYNNLGGLLNAINGGAQGLLSGFSANASGANNYDRNNPRKLLTGSNFNLGGFNPGLLQFFPKGG